jgi:hypothetical protein
MCNTRAYSLERSGSLHRAVAAEVPNGHWHSLTTGLEVLTSNIQHIHSGPLYIHNERVLYSSLRLHEACSCKCWDGGGVCNHAIRRCVTLTRGERDGGSRGIGTRGLRILLIGDYII